MHSHIVHAALEQKICSSSVQEKGQGEQPSAMPVQDLAGSPAAL